jgi:hypothetical protein
MRLRSSKFQSFCHAFLRCMQKSNSFEIHKSIHWSVQAKFDFSNQVLSHNLQLINNYSIFYDKIYHIWKTNWSNLWILFKNCPKKHTFAKYFTFFMMDDNISECNSNSNSVDSFDERKQNHQGQGFSQRWREVNVGKGNPTSRKGRIEIIILPNICRYKKKPRSYLFLSF